MAFFRNPFSRRDFLASSLAGSVLAVSSSARGAEDPEAAEPIIDIHQHTN